MESKENFQTPNGDSTKKKLTLASSLQWPKQTIRKFASCLSKLLVVSNCDRLTPLASADSPPQLDDQSEDFTINIQSRDLISDAHPIPATLGEAGAWHFWVAVALTGLGAGVGATVLTFLLEWVQHFSWSGSSQDLLSAVINVPADRKVIILIGAGLITALGQVILRRLTTGNGIEISEALWTNAGRLPTLRTLGSATLSVVVVGMGASLGREGAPKQAGAVLANLCCNVGRLSDDQRRLLVACGAGAGMAAAYGVPLGGALFALEVLRGVLALRFILPALMASLLACLVSWQFLPNAPTYLLPELSSSAGPMMLWALLAGPIIGLCSVGYVRAVAWTDKHRPTGKTRLLAPILVFGAVGVVSIRFPEVLGNGKDLAQLAFSGAMLPGSLIVLLLLRPIATLCSLGSGTPGGLFTPTLAIGATLGGALGLGWTYLFPGEPLGLFAIIGGAALLAASTQGPISAVVLLIEMTGHDRFFIAPVLMTVVTATLVARSLEVRSIYDARLTDQEVEQRLKMRQETSVFRRK